MFAHCGPTEVRRITSRSSARSTAGASMAYRWVKDMLEPARIEFSRAWENASTLPAGSPPPCARACPAASTAVTRPNQPARRTARRPVDETGMTYSPLTIAEDAIARPGLHPPRYAPAPAGEPPGRADLLGSGSENQAPALRQPTARIPAPISREPPARF